MSKSNSTRDVANLSNEEEALPGNGVAESAAVSSSPTSPAATKSVKVLEVSVDVDNKEAPRPASPPAGRGLKRQGSQQLPVQRSSVGEILNFGLTPEQQAVKGAFRSRAKEDLDRGPIWEFKTFLLFPMLVRLSGLDHLFRILFPVAYIVYVICAFAEVDFGRPQYALLQGSPCFNQYS